MNPPRKDTLLKMLNARATKTHLGSYDFQVHATHKRFMQIKSHSYFKASTPCTPLISERPWPHEQLFQDLNREGFSVGSCLKTEQAPRQTWTLPAPPALCTLRTTLVEVFGLPTSKPTCRTRWVLSMFQFFCGFIDMPRIHTFMTRKWPNHKIDLR